MSDAEQSPDFSEDEPLVDINVFACQLADMARGDKRLLDSITHEQFLEMATAADMSAPYSFDAIRQRAREVLEACCPECVDMAADWSVPSQGRTVVVVGDSHGAHAIPGAVRCVANLARYLDADIVHVGHALDVLGNLDTGVANLPRLTFVCSENEAIRLLQMREEHSWGYDVIKGSVRVGPSIIMHQELRADYTKSGVVAAGMREPDASVIVGNLHLHEIGASPRQDGEHVLASPGCLCYPHVSKRPPKRPVCTVDALIDSLPANNRTYRRQQQMAEMWWQTGALVLHIREDHCTVIPCRLREVDGTWTTLYYDRIVTERSIETPDWKYLVVSDAHAPAHTPETFALVSRIAADLLADELVVLGDHVDARACNHHMLERGEVPQHDLLEEFVAGRYLLRKMRSWGAHGTLVLGNHCRFLEDFSRVHPQLRRLLDAQLLLAAEREGYSVYGLKSVYSAGVLKFHHGDLRFRGGRGDYHEKASEALGRNSFFGHVHCPTARCDTYSVGMMCQIDQGYNEPVVDRWVPGFGIAAVWCGVPFLSTIGAPGNAVSLGGRFYLPGDVESWKVPAFKAVLDMHVL